LFSLLMARCRANRASSFHFAIFILRAAIADTFAERRFRHIYAPHVNTPPLMMLDTLQR